LEVGWRHLLESRPEIQYIGMYLAAGRLYRKNVPFRCWEGISAVVTWGRNIEKGMRKMWEMYSKKEETAKIEEKM
jgi:hypothetical protein